MYYPAYMLCTFVFKALSTTCKVLFQNMWCLWWLYQRLEKYYFKIWGVCDVIICGGGVLNNHHQSLFQRRTARHLVKSSHLGYNINTCFSFSNINFTWLITMLALPPPPLPPDNVIQIYYFIFEQTIYSGAPKMPQIDKIVLIVIIFCSSIK